MDKTYKRIRAQYHAEGMYQPANIYTIGPLEIYLLSRGYMNRTAKTFLMRDIRKSYEKAHPRKGFHETEVSEDTMWTWAFESGWITKDVPIKDIGNDQREAVLHWNLGDQTLEAITVKQKAYPRLHKMAQEEYIDVETGIIGAVLAPLPYGRALYGTPIFYPFSQDLIVYAGDNNRPAKIDLLNKSFEDLADSVFDYAAVCGYNLRANE